MAPRAFWTGHLRLSLVNIPVKLYPATSSERRIELHQIHEPTGKRIRYQKVAPGVGPVENEEIIKGYEYEKGKYVLIDPKEIDDLKLEAKQTIELVRFVDEGAIDDRYYETPYYLLPDGELADEGYMIVQKALKDTGKIGVGQFILRGHGNIVAIKPFGKGLLLEILRHANEVRAAEPIFKEIAETKVDKEALDLAKELIKRKSGKFEPEEFKDQYNEAVWELIQAKLEKRAPEIATEIPGTAKVINIMDALKKSVQQGKGAAPAKAPAKRAAASAKASGKKTAKSAPKRKSA
ncbi:Ku protein [Methyloceanibacter sp.]|uniref:non-homologous end joining protein Ku n=1 Tax=Methyloceanibacter sp. TaxID=1965321 RepID=UPI002D448B42|nr:Ku protein [Methyloceanibacter sp.]HZP10367.1 Ku protein [Methyloceanibacter sp.]